MTIVGLDKTNFRDVFVAFDTSYQNGFTQAETKWDQVAMEIPSAGESNSYPFLGMSPQLREWVGNRQVRSMEAYAYNVVNKPFEATIEVPRNKIADDQYGVLLKSFEMLGQRAATHPDKLIFDLLNSSRSENCYDGTPFHGASHPTHGGSVQSNIDSGGSGPYWYIMDTTKPVKPMLKQDREPYELVALNQETDPNVFWSNSYVYGVRGRGNAGFGFWQYSYASNQSLDATNFASALADMMAIQDDQGEPMGVRPSVLVVPTSLYVDALEIASVDRLASGATNPFKGLNLKVLVSERLANS